MVLLLSKRTKAFECLFVPYQVLVNNLLAGHELIQLGLGIDILLVSSLFILKSSCVPSKHCQLMYSATGLNAVHHNHQEWGRHTDEAVAAGSGIVIVMSGSVMCSMKLIPCPLLCPVRVLPC
jgi:hypothetical protein